MDARRQTRSGKENKMDPAELEEKLRREGFVHTYVWRDRPGATYQDHTHPAETAHIVLEGEMTLEINGHSRTYRAGERCDVPAGTVHAARMGSDGCTYLIGEK
jgi:quercetin dioxygenase-like cupin family protein